MIFQATQWHFHGNHYIVQYSMYTDFNSVCLQSKRMSVTRYKSRNSTCTTIVALISPTNHNAFCRRKFITKVARLNYNIQVIFQKPFSFWRWWPWPYMWPLPLNLNTQQGCFIFLSHEALITCMVFEIIIREPKLYRQTCGQIQFHFPGCFL